MTSFTCVSALSTSSTFSFGIIMSSKLKDKPPLNAIVYPNSLISSRNCAVLDVPEIFRTPPMISLSAFFVKTSFIKPASLGTCSLNITRPQVVSINCNSDSPTSFKSSVFTLILACKSSFPSLYAIITSAGE